jgi:sterol desaturase/sphingolipid hydroxylase (fatty acid hydroxylase superfamily)
MPLLFAIAFTVACLIFFFGGVMWFYAKLQLSHTRSQGKKVNYTFNLLEERWQSMIDLGRTCTIAASFMLFFGLVTFNMLYVRGLIEKNERLLESNQLLTSQLVGVEKPAAINLKDICPK